MTQIYISPTGLGDRSGSSAANARPITVLNEAIKQAGPGGEVLLVADNGAYDLWQSIIINNGGKDGAPVTIRGISSTGEAMTAHFEGTRNPTYVKGQDAGNELFRLYAGADHLVFSGMDIKDTGVAFRVGGNISDLTIQNISAENVQRFFENNTNSSKSTATIDGLTIKNVDVEGFSKGVIRLQYDTHDVLIENVTGDSAGQNGDLFAIGVHLEGTAHDVVIRKTVMANAQNMDNAYWNGDAFATENGVYNVIFEDTLGKGSTDAGYDLKSKSTTLIRAIAEDNSKNFKLWGEITLIDSVGVDPHSRGGTNGQVQLQIEDKGNVKVIRGTFIDSGENTYVFAVKGQVSFKDTVVQLADDAHLTNNKYITGYDGVSVSELATTGQWSVDTLQTINAAETSNGTPHDVPVAPVVEPAAPVVEPAAPATEPDAPVTSPVIPVTDPVAPIVAPAAPVPEPATEPATPLTTPTPPVATAPTAPAIERTVWQIGVDNNPHNSAGQDVYVVDTALRSGIVRLDKFGSTDILLTSTAFADSDKDGIIKAGGDKIFNEKDGDAVDLGKVISIRHLGELDGKHAYGDLAVRAKGATEGSFSGDRFKGDAVDKRADLFFFDTAIQYSLGNDRIEKFGATDKIVTTQALTAGADGNIHAGSQGFALHGTDIDDHVAVTGMNDVPVDTLVLVDHAFTNGVEYFTYMAPSPLAI